MPTALAKQAVVVGAGMAGLTAARALADHFEQVLVLERDRLPGGAADRVGIPQGRHVHVLLAGGQQALEELFPQFGGCLSRSGAVPLRVGLDLRVERPGYDPFPRRDLGWDHYWMSRAQIEWTVRDLVRGAGNIEIRDRCRVEELIASRDGSAVVGVRYARSPGGADTIDTDLVVDASGQGRLTLLLLDSIGQPAPAETTLGVDLAYSTAIFAIPGGTPDEWKGVYCFPAAPRSSRGALLAPIEGGRWILTLAGRGGEMPPRDADGFMAYARDLRTPTIHDAVQHAKLLGDVAHFRFPESTLRHYERCDRFPAGLLPIGDAICRFNPIYGQGMSVAAQEAWALRRLLDTRHGQRDPLDRIASAFFAQAHALIDTPWASAALPDLVYPDTRGERPENFRELLRFGAALGILAARDPAVHRLTAEVQHLLKPRSVYFDPELASRVLAVMAEGHV